MVDRTKWPKAYVVFCNSSLSGLRIFKKNFRHVAVIIQNDATRQEYIQLNPASLRTTVEPSHIACIRMIHRGSIRSGVTVLKVAIPPSTGRKITFGLLPYSCVEVIKRVLGVRAWWIVTPYQLYKHLKKGKHYEYQARD